MQATKQDQPSAFVFVMWMLTFCAWLMALGGGAVGAMFGLLLDFTAIAIAIVFLNGRNEANRKAARARLWLELTVFIIGIIVSRYEAQNGRS